MNLINLFDISLKGRKNKIALEFGDQQLTFGEIDARSNRMANLLQAKGFTTGDRLCVYLENCIEIIDLFVACAKIGVIFVPINILYKEREMGHILSDAEPKALISNGEIPGSFEAWQLTAVIDEVKGQPDTPVGVYTNGDSPAALVYTSGTTGTSKGAILTHNNFIANGINLNACWQINENDRFLLALPLFHVHALGNGLHCWLMSGCTMRLLPRFEHSKPQMSFYRLNQRCFLVFRRFTYAFSISRKG